MKPIIKGLFCLSLALSALAWTGCGSVVPISDVGDAVVRPDLVGQWRAVAPEEDDAGQMLVLKFDDHAYYVELREEDDEPFDEDVIRLRVFLTEIGGTSFVNAQNIDALDDDERVYFFYTIALGEDGALTITELQDVGDQKIDKFETSAALRAFIERNLDNDALYGDSITFVKVEKVAG